MLIPFRYVTCAGILLFQSGYDYASDFFFLGFDDGKPRKAITIVMKVNSSDAIVLYRGNLAMSSWERLYIAESTPNSVTFFTDKEGVFVARYKNTVSAAVISVIVVLCILFVGGAIAGMFIYFRRNPSSYHHIRSLNGNSFFYYIHFL